MSYAFELEALGYVALAMLMGAAIGFERQVADKPAGMRTHMLVAGAAALLVFVGDLLVNHLGERYGSGLIRADPTRIIEAVVTGVAFLGAGTIIRRGGPEFVEGLTTAGALLFTAAVGIGVALKELVLSGGATVLALATLRLVRLLETRLVRKVGKRP